MRLFLCTTAMLGAACGLAGCNAADRAALAGIRAPEAPVAATPGQIPAAANAALLFPPAAHRSPPRLRHASTASHMWSRSHRAFAVVARPYEQATYAEQSVTIRAQDGWGRAEERQADRRVEAEARWDDRRTAWAEGYGPLRAERPVAAAGRDRDGFLSWPGKNPDRR